jgi:hypothetical protein
MVGGVTYPYYIGELETTASQYVTYLNTVDPSGNKNRQLYYRDMSSSVWPRYGEINYSSSAATGHHYSLSYPEWGNKPLNFSTFARAALFANSLTNGKILSKTTSQSDGFTIYNLRVKLSPNTDSGMYNLYKSGHARSHVSDPGATRSRSTGFVIPSQNEWIKAAYYDPNGGGTYSYWLYPTGPHNAPHAALVNAQNGNVVNASKQPVSSYSPQGPSEGHHTSGAKSGTYPAWCPSQLSTNSCDSTNPLHLSEQHYMANFQANLSTVGETKSRSPWGTLDQGGNVVEWTDTISTVDKSSHSGPKVWRRMHGGIANAKAYQLWISAIGIQPEDNVLAANIYPWMGFRVGFIGNP